MSFKSILQKLDQLNEGAVNEVSDADLDAHSLAKHKSRLKREKTRMGLSMPKPDGGPSKADVPAAARRARGEEPLSLKDLMEDSDNDSPVFQSIIRRIMMTKMDLLEKYGPEKIIQAAEDIADSVGDVEEIGTSDVSGWVREVERSLESLQEATGRVHRGGYGTEYQGDGDDEDDDKKVKKVEPTVKRGRGRPKKAADNTGQVKNYDTQTLSNWIIGNLPKKLPKGVSTTKHKLKDWMEHVETTMLAESIVAEGGVKAIAELIDMVKTGELDVYDILSGKYAPTSKAEEVFAKQLQRKYDEIAAEMGLHPDDDFEKIQDILIDEIDNVLSEQDQVSIEPAKATAHVIKQGNQVLGQVENPQLANTIKQAIGQGQMTLAGSNLKESVEPRDGLQSIIMLFPHEHKMCQDGWGMDPVFVDALADYYHQAGKIPHSIWRGPVEQLHEYVQECYAKDTMMMLGEQDDEQLDEILPALGAVAGRALAGSAGAGSAGKMAGSMLGSKVGSEIQDVFGSDDMDEAVDPAAVTRHSMTGLLKTLDEYASDKERVEPKLGTRQGKILDRTSGSRSDGSSRYEPRYTGPKSKSSSLGKEIDSLRYDRSSPSYMEEENDTGEHSPITGDEVTTTPKPLKPLYPTGKENKMKTYDVVSDKMADKMMYEGKKQKYDKDYYDSIDAAKKDGAKSIVKRRKSAVAEESTTKRDDRAERAGKRVARDIEYDERKKDGIHGKRRDSEDARAERAGRRVAKDIEYDEKMNEAAKPDFLDLDKDGNKKESMKKAAADKKRQTKLDELSQDTLQSYSDKVGKDLYKSVDKTLTGKERDRAERRDRNQRVGHGQAQIKLVGKALDKHFAESQISEAWDTDYETPESEKGKYKGKTIAELKKMKAALMKKEKRTKAEQGKVAELNFAIRAKQKGSGKWGKVKSEGKDVQMETWERALSGMLMESVTVNTTTGTDPDTNSVNISATGEDAAQLMALLQNAGLHAGATTGGYQQVQYQMDDSEQMNEETTEAEFTIPEGATMPMPKGMGVSQNVDECGDVKVIEPATQDEVIGTLGVETDDDSNNLLDFIKKIMSHGAQQYGDSAPKEVDYADERVSEADVEEGNEFSGALAKAKASGAKEFEVDGKKYPVKEEGEYWAEEKDSDDEEDDFKDWESDDDEYDGHADELKFQAHLKKQGKKEFDEGYEDGNWAAMRSDDKIQDADAVAYHAGADTTNRDPNLNVTEEPEHGRKGDGKIADPTFAGKNRQGRVSEGEHETCNECGGMYEGDGHKCEESLNEWANSPMGQSEDEEFKTEMEFMTKAISGGLNNMKQDQTTLPSTRVRTGAESAPRGAEMSIGAELKRLAGIN